MGVIVQKFGGSSVADTEKLFNLCRHITKEYNEGNKVVVVVSAQGKMTDKLVNEASEITSKPNPREYDVLLSAGEQITIAKLAMCLEELGYKSISYMGWQVPIITDSNHLNSRIKYIENRNILKDLEEGKIVIIAGFQGIDKEGNITTLGRGGSDTTAVSIASSLNADRCEIYTDVDGIFSGDPRIIHDVKKLNTISFDEMLELSSMGAKVLHNRCVEIGKKYDTVIHVKSTFDSNSKGTIVGNKDDNFEHLVVSGITKEDNNTRITVIYLNNKMNNNIFKLLAENNINVDIIVKANVENKDENVSFSVNTNNLDKTLEILNSNLDKVNAKKVLHSKNFSKISVVGIGMINTPGVASTIFETLYENDINIHMISTSEIKVSVLVDIEKADLAVRVLHDKFFLRLDLYGNGMCNSWDGFSLPCTCCIH